MNALIAEALRMALSKGHSPASKGACVVSFLRLRSGVLYLAAIQVASATPAEQGTDRVDTCWRALIR